MKNALVKTDFKFPGQKSVYHGKVRDVYNIDDELLVMVVSDRISAFDVILPEGIPYKGQVLNQIAAKFLDAKYEFGKIGDKIILIDEIHTPDSSRYFYAEGYEDRLARGEEQRQLSKEFVRQWLIQNGFQGKEGQQVPEMTEEYCNSVSDRYIELYEHIVGEKFVKAEGEDVAARIEKHVTDFLNNRKK